MPRIRKVLPPETVEKILARIGEDIPDKTLARELGVHYSCVRYRRYLLGINSHKRGIRHKYDQAIVDRIWSLFNDHKTKQEIADELHLTIGSLSETFTRLRKRGYKLPYFQRIRNLKQLKQL